MLIAEILELLFWGLFGPRHRPPSGQLTVLGDINPDPPSASRPR